MTTNTEQPNSPVQRTVLEKIRDNQLTMRPRAFFTLQVVALIVVALLALLVSVFILSFILFSLRMSGQSLLLGYGSRGWYRFFALFPWGYLALDLFLLLGLEWLLRHFRFGYRRPIVYLLLGVLAVTISLSVLVDRGTRLHEKLLRQADGRMLPVFGNFYEEVRRPHRGGICRCIITAIEGNTLTVVDDHPRGTSTPMKIVLPPSEATSSLKIGDRLFIAGDELGGELRAFGLRPFPPPPSRDFP
jgi:hypothetical protein